MVGDSRGSLAIINVLPDLTLEENAAKIVIGRQRGIKLGTEEGDMLIELAECTSVLESFAKTALQNRWKERTRITTDSIMS